MKAELKVCMRCAEEYSSAMVGLPVIMRLQRLSKDEHLSYLVTNENLSPELAELWLRHEYYAACPKKYAYCPHCGEALATWRAQQCLSCHRQWHKPKP